MLRWNCALLIGVTFLSLIGYCWVGCAMCSLVTQAKAAVFKRSLLLASFGFCTLLTMILLAKASLYNQHRHYDAYRTSSSVLN